MSNSREQHQPQQHDPAYGAAHKPSLAALVRALAAVEPEPLTCAECRTQFPALYHLQTEGTPLPVSAQAALAHLAGCPDCAAEYDALQAVLGELAAGTLPTPAAAPTFDLSFLALGAASQVTSQVTSQATGPTPAQGSVPDTTPAAPPGRAPAFWQQVGRAHTWQFLAGIEVRLRAAGSTVYATFGALPGALTPAPALSVPPAAA